MVNQALFLGGKGTLEGGRLTSHQCWRENTYWLPLKWRVCHFQNGRSDRQNCNICIYILDSIDARLIDSRWSSWHTWFMYASCLKEPRWPPFSRDLEEVPVPSSRRACCFPKKSSFAKRLVFFLLLQFKCWGVLGFLHLIACFTTSSPSIYQDVRITRLQFIFICIIMYKYNIRICITTKNLQLPPSHPP